MVLSYFSLAGLIFVVCVGCLSSFSYASVFQSGNEVVVQTDYLQVVYDTADNSITKVFADFHGGKNFTQNVLSSPINLEIQRKELPMNKPTSKLLNVEKQDQKITLRAEFHLEGHPVVQQTLNIICDSNLRSVKVSVQGEMLNDLNNVVSFGYGIYVPNPSLYGLFSTGIVQMMGKTHGCLGSADKLERAYFLGGGSALDVVFSTSTNYETVFISNTDAAYPYRSGVQFVLFGEYPEKSKEMSLAWSNQCWNSKLNHTSTVSIAKGANFSFDLTLFPNNYDFPVYTLNNIQETTKNIPFIDLRTSLTGIYGSAVGCLQSYYNKQTGIIAPTISHPDVGYSPDANFFDPDNFITLSAILYSGDDYLIKQVGEVLERTAQTMCGVGNDTIASYCNQKRQRTKHSQMISFGRFSEIYQKKRLSFGGSSSSSVNTPVSSELYDSTSRSGQLMHHFVNLVPTYESIAGSEQLGPNIFWTITALKYISVTQDYSFANRLFQFIDLSCKYVLTFIDKNYYLINAPGPLWIDVLIREQYTSDSNSMIIAFIDEMVEFYQYLDAHAHSISPVHEFDDFIAELQQTRQEIIKSFNKYLWISNIPNVPNTANDTKDHFVTQLNTDFTTYRDFIDYDSNLMAIAFNLVTDVSQQQSIIKRVDSGPYTHVRATWCSEIPYTGDADDCYIVGGSVCGDSVVTLARIGYIDAIARRQIGDIDTYVNLLLTPLQQDLIKDVWLYERYDSHGQQIRTSYYFEYPSLIAMMVREISYGIETKLNEIVIRPFTVDSFDYKVGNNVEVHFSQSLVVLRNHPLLHGDTSNESSMVSKLFSIYRLQPTTSYQIQTENCGNVSGFQTSDDNGLLQFRAVFLNNCQITISKMT
jgi:hypothetical protein